MWKAFTARRRWQDRLPTRECSRELARPKSGERAETPMGSASLLWSATRRSMPFWRSVWIRGCTRTRGTIAIASHGILAQNRPRTDSDGEALSTWRLGSAYGSAFLSNEWYPDRLNTVRQGVAQGSLRLGFDFAANLGSEFWPDIKGKILYRKR